MKKIITLFFTIVTLGYAEVGDYKSEFGVGVGLGIPSGYEFKGIYRYNEWLSLSLNYNLFQIKGFTEEINETDTQLTVTGDLIFSNPGIVLNYHPFGENLKLMAGFLYDMGGLEVNADGNFNVEVDNNTIPTTVTGHIKIKLGQTYPYLGVAWGNILNLAQIAADVLGMPSTIILPNEQNLENDIVGLIQDGYSVLPEFMGYNLLPVISVGFTFFPFN